MKFPSLPGYALLLSSLLASPVTTHAGDTPYISQWSQDHPKKGRAYCGPVAAANSLTALYQADAKSPLATLPPREVAQHLADAMGTHPEFGTPVPFVASGARLLLRAYGYANAAVRIYGPGTDPASPALCQQALQNGHPVLVCVRLYEPTVDGKWTTNSGHWFSLKSMTASQMVLVDPTRGWEITSLIQDAPETLSEQYDHPKKVLHATAFRGNFTVLDSIVVLKPGKRTRPSVAKSQLPRQSVKTTERYTRLYMPKKQEGPTQP